VVVDGLPAGALLIPQTVRQIPEGRGGAVFGYLRQSVAGIEHCGHVGQRHHGVRAGILQRQPITAHVISVARIRAVRAVYPYQPVQLVIRISGGARGIRHGRDISVVVVRVAILRQHRAADLISELGEPVELVVSVSGGEGLTAAQRAGDALDLTVRTVPVRDFPGSRGLYLLEPVFVVPELTIKAIRCASAFYTVLSRHLRRTVPGFITFSFIIFHKLAVLKILFFYPKMGY